MTKTQSVVLRLIFCATVFLGVIAGVASAQSAPNCNQQNAILTAAGTGVNYNATSVKCVAWTLSYFSQGFSAVSIQIESAPDVAGTPGAFTVVPAANVTLGTNPLTSLVSGTLTIAGYFPWLRVNLVTATGTGSVNYTLIGNSYVGPSSQVTAVAGSVATTVKAIGPDAPGAATTQNPVQESGVDGGGLVRRLLTDTTGRLNIAGTNATGTDAIPNGNLSILSNAGVIGPSEVAPFLYDGATQWNRERQAGINTMPVATTLTGRNSIGTQITEYSSRFTVVSSPAVSTQASASIAAAGSVNHVLTHVCFSAVSSTAPALTLVDVVVRDGASGAGTIIAQFKVAITAATGQNVTPFCSPDLNLVGTTNTAMTAEFSALVTNVFESVTLTGYNIN
jgi:hypothetical protein